MPSAVCLHLFLQYRASFLNSPGKGSTSRAFPVSSILGDNGGAKIGSFRVSSVEGLLLIVYSASRRNVLGESSSKRLPCSLMRLFITLLMDLICLSHADTQKLLARAGFVIQSMLALRSSALIFSSTISLIAFLSSVSVPMKLVPLWQRFSQSGPLAQDETPKGAYKHIGFQGICHSYVHCCTCQTSKQGSLFLDDGSSSMGIPRTEEVYPTRSEGRSGRHPLLQ